MLTSDEIQQIDLGFKTISENIEKILNIINILNDNQQILLTIIENCYTKKFPNFDAELSDLLSLENEYLRLKDSFPKHLVNADKIDIHFQKYLISEVGRYTRTHQYLLENVKVTNIFNYLKNLTEDTTLATKSEQSIIDDIVRLPNTYIKNYHNLQNILSSYSIFDTINDFSGNIVLVGANGSGKTSFAMQFNDLLTENITILSAQHLLSYTPATTISAKGDELDKVRAFQKSDKRSSNANFNQLILNDFNNLISALISEYFVCCTDYYKSDTKNSAVLDRISKLWEDVVKHRFINIETSGLVVGGPNIPVYPFNNLSDGEKAIFYYIAHVMISPDNSYIIVDEPENHLHSSVCHELWNKLESVRPDCKFVYLTHNISFATTRSNSTLIWNKSYSPPNNWSFELVSSEMAIPNSLICELMGTRSNILFCEGNSTSLDYQLYSLIFPNYRVVPVSGHRDVITYTRTFNLIESFTTNAVGIIDGDFHTTEQISKWEADSIYVLKISEIENLLCDSTILEAAISHFYSDNTINDYFEKFWPLLIKNKEQLATEYLSEYLNRYFTDNSILKHKTIDALKQDIDLLTLTNNIDVEYNAFIEDLDDIINRKDYPNALKIVNFKKQLTKQLCSQIIIEDYENKALALIRNRSDLKQHLLHTYFNNVPN